MAGHVEDRRVEALRAIFADGPAPRALELDLGDDAAVLEAGDEHEVLSVDAHVEGVHFERRWIDLVELGARATMAAASDLAAMGASPTVLLLSLALPPSIDDEALEALARGVNGAAKRLGAKVVGGNLTRARELSLHTTVVGRMREAPLRRDGARVGDGVWVTGTLGAAALGLSALMSGRGDEAALAEVVARWRRPLARIEEGRRLVGVASAAMDVSDGLVVDLTRLLRASAVGAEIEAARLPLAPRAEEAARALGLDATSRALFGGEDYELLFTAPPSVRLDGWATRVGEVIPPPGVLVRWADGSIEPASGGYDHFEGRSFEPRVDPPPSSRRKIF